jgi:O-antigen ligase
VDKTVRMKKPINSKDLTLLIPILLTPIFGSVALGFILITAVLLSFYFIVKKNQNSTPKLFKTIGMIFISYFTYYSAQGLFFSDSYLQHIHDIGKIFPILIIGVLALLLKANTFKINYKMLSLFAVSSLYLTSVLAVIFRFFPPDIIILGDPITAKTGVLGRLEMGTGNALPLGTIFVTFAFLTCLGYEEKSTLQRIISFSALILGILVVGFWNGSRGPLLVVAPLTFLMLWYLSKCSKSEKSLRPLIFGFISIALLGIFCIIMQNFGHNMAINMVNGLKELTHSGSHDTSVNIRLTIYKAGLNAFFVKPIFGFGIGNLFDSIIVFLPEHTNFGYSHLHNMFLNHIIAGGLVGLPFLFMLATSPLVIIWQKRDTITTDGIYLSLLLIMTIFGAGMSNVLFFHDLLAGFFSVLILIAAVASNEKDKE